MISWRRRTMTYLRSAPLEGSALTNMPAIRDCRLHDAVVKASASAVWGPAFKSQLIHAVDINRSPKWLNWQNVSAIGLVGPVSALDEAAIV